MPAEENFAGAFAELDDSFPGLGLRWSLRHVTGDVHSIVPDSDETKIEADVGPTQAAEFAAAESFEHGDLVERGQPLGLDQVEESAGLRQGPRCELRLAVLRQLDVLRRVVRQSPGLDRCAERGTQGAENPGHRRNAQWLAAFVRFDEYPVDRGDDLAVSELFEAQVPDEGNPHFPHVRRVGPACAGTEPLLAVQPGREVLRYGLLVVGGHASFDSPEEIVTLLLSRSLRWEA